MSKRSEYGFAVAVGFLSALTVTLYANELDADSFHDDSIPSYRREAVSPVYADLNISENDERLIEPTSAILGVKFVRALRTDPRPVAEILATIEREYPEWRADAAVSAEIYFRLLTPGIAEYCDKDPDEQEQPDEAAYDVVEKAAIPYEILRPLLAPYRKEIALGRVRADREELGALQEKASVTALSYQKRRFECKNIQNLEKLENTFKRFFPKRYDKLIDLHHRISAPESAYPRVQFTVNGFTQYVYGELFKLPMDRLKLLLETMIDAESAWIQERRVGMTPDRFLGRIETVGLSRGLLPREILLGVAYATRNWPSIDIHYAVDPDRALLLEASFWKLREMRDVAQKIGEKELYPLKVMKRNPGVYHYATAALMACEVRLAGYSAPIARTTALVNKVGYKLSKFIGEVGKGRGNRPVDEKGKKTSYLKYLRQVYDKQAFGPGIQAGQYGGKWGVRLCAKHTPKEHWRKRIKPGEEPESIFTEMALEDWELSVDPAIEAIIDPEGPQ